ncbi:FmdB family zinc ribbon protein [Fodinibius sp. Rm-B-1B1-1]|uniref:FmdB family zinc ribbon protein n=1 Tax=Fodinibius alkaliphilus TaxID=3140241 RepID=UPI00315B17B7
MPTYKYKREDGTTFEVRQSINDDALEECPETGQKVKRVISGGGGVVYKGDGFYVTDYKNKENGSKGSSNGSAQSAKASSESSENN